MRLALSSSSAATASAGYHEAIFARNRWQCYLTRMNPASTLEDAIFLFDPLKSLSEPEELASFYVDRGSDVRTHFSLMLRNSDIRQKTPIKLLFTGHKGCGKSTEINKLCLELGNQFFIVKVQSGKRPDVTYTDVLLKAAMSLLKEANDKEVIKRSLAQKTSGIWDKATGFVEKVVFGEVSLPTDTTLPSEMTAKISFFGLEFENKFEAEPETRENMRRTSETRISEIINNINLMSDRVRADTGKPVLLVFEDTDRLDVATAKELFYERAVSLTQFRVSAIFLLDIGLRYSDRFAGLRQHFHDFKVLPNIKLRTREGAPYPVGESLLKQIILNRLDPSLIETDALQIFIENSGGLARTLMSLMRDASLVAAARGSQKIEANDAQRAVNRLRGDFVALLSSKDYAVLNARHLDKDLNNDAEIQSLLEKLALLEYANDETWCDVHPILLPEIQRRMRQRVELPAGSLIESDV